jgi:hypothetical protein
VFAFLFNNKVLDQYPAEEKKVNHEEGVAEQSGERSTTPFVETDVDFDVKVRPSCSVKRPRISNPSPTKEVTV